MATQPKPNGKDQTDAMAELAKPWTPDNVGGIRVGDLVKLPAIDCTFEVIGLADPLLILRAPSGREVRAGWRAVSKVRTRAEIEGTP